MDDPENFSVIRDTVSVTLPRGELGPVRVTRVAAGQVTIEWQSSTVVLPDQQPEGVVVTLRPRRGESVTVTTRDLSAIDGYPSVSLDPLVCELSFVRACGAWHVLSHRLRS